MGKIVIARKYVKACTALPRSQKKKRKIVEQNCQQKDLQKVGLKVLELSWEMNWELIDKLWKISER